MCQQHQYDMSSQIEVLVENGMPRKIGKSVAKTLKKRAAAANNNNNSEPCINCETCGGCSNQKNLSNQRCVCNSYDLAAISASDESAKEYIQNSESEISPPDVPSNTRVNNTLIGLTRQRCPVASMLGNNKTDTITTESRRLSDEIISTPSIEQFPPTEMKANLLQGYQGDILAVFTQLTRNTICGLNDICNRMQKSKTYRVLSSSTQPAHVIAVSIVSFVLLAVSPTLLENEDAALQSNKRRSGWALVAYLGAFATHFGAQIWMTFVSGLSLYFALPRHTFGLCQQILFPKYFAMNSMLSILTLILFIKVIAGRWEFSSYVQVIALTICAVIEVAVRLYLAPPLLRLMREKHKFEVSVGSGQEVGQLEQRDLVKCPHYQNIHKAFRRIHMTVAMGNLTALVCTFLHLNYLASKISVG